MAETPLWDNHKVDANLALMNCRTGSCVGQGYKPEYFLYPGSWLMILLSFSFFFCDRKCSFSLWKADEQTSQLRRTSCLGLSWVDQPDKQAFCHELQLDVPCHVHTIVIFFAVHTTEEYLKAHMLNLATLQDPALQAYSIHLKFSVSFYIVKEKCDNDVSIHFLLIVAKQDCVGWNIFRAHKTTRVEFCSNLVLHAC